MRPNFPQNFFLNFELVRNDLRKRKFQRLRKLNAKMVRDFKVDLPRVSDRKFWRYVYVVYSYRSISITISYCTDIVH